MKKEKIKNITLVILILISIGLFSNMWLGEKLWSEGYDFFAFFDIFLKKPDESTGAFAIDDIITPRKFVIGGGDRRSIVADSDSGYSRCVSEVMGVFKSTDGDFVPASREQWRSGLKSRSVLVDFGIPVSAQLLEETEIPAPRDGVFSKILIVPENGYSKRCEVYFEDYNTSEISKTASSSNQQAILSLISGYTETGNAINIPYAFELGFDSVKLDENKDISQNILLDATLSLGLSERLVPITHISSRINDRNAEKITKNFFDAGMSVRRYVQKDGSNVFVNRKSSLKVSPRGFVEYTAESEGKKLTSAKSTDAETVSAVMSLVRSICARCNLSSAKFQLYNAPSLDDSGVTHISLNYLAGSEPVMFADDDGNAMPAISAEIKNGRLVYFKFYICEISQQMQSTKLPSMLKAIDSLYSQAKGEKLEVSDLYVSYIADGKAQALSPSWCARIKNSDRVIIVDGE